MTQRIGTTEIHRSDTRYTQLGTDVDDVIAAMNQVTSGVTNPEQWLIDAIGGHKTDSGVRVNEYSAMSYPPVYYAVSKIAGHIGTLPLRLRRRDAEGRGSHLVEDDPRVELMRHPSSYLTSQLFRETLQHHALLNGNGRAAIYRRADGTPTELIPLLPQNTFTRLVDGNKEHITLTPSDWHYTLPMDDGSMYRFDDANVLHIPGLGYNGVWGYSLIDLAREVFGLGLAGQQATSNAFQNLGRPGVILNAPPGKLRDPKKAQELVDSFDAKQKGINNTGRTALLRDGITATVLPVSSEDAAFLDQRGFQREDTALVFLLETILGDSSGSTYKSISERNTQYATNCLSRWARKWELECDRKLLSEQDRADGLFWKFDLHELLEGDPNTLADYTGKLRQQGAINGNDVRQMHRMSYVDDPALNSYLNPNTTTQRTLTASVSDGDADLGGEDIRSDRGNALADAAVRMIVSRMISTERQRVVNAAGNKPDYLAWVDTFYAGWGDKFAQTLSELGVDPHHAHEHCAANRAAVKQIAKLADPASLADIMERGTADWDAQADELTESILHGALTDV